MEINNVLISGRLGADPEVRRFDNGSMVANFRLAHEVRFKDKNGETKERTDWHNVSAVGKIAEFVQQYIGKGRRVLVEGYLRKRDWTDKDGNKREVVEVVAMQVHPLDRPKENDQRGSGNGGTRPRIKSRAESEYDTNHGDLPF